MKKFLTFVRGRLASFRPAFAGWRYVVRTQPNAWIHLVITVSVFLLGWWLGIDRQDWLAILLATGLVWSAELLNTSVEVVIDLVSPGHHDLAKAAKDVAAGAVVIAALTALIVGALVLGPPLLAR